MRPERNDMLTKRSSVHIRKQHILAHNCNCIMTKLFRSRQIVIKGA
jgi:hypothetical protein